jgi:hypothetical protein
MESSSKLATAFSPRALVMITGFSQPMLPKMIMRFSR